MDQFPSSRSQSGMRAGDDIRRDDGATARGLAPWIGSPPLAPSQGYEQEMTSAGMTGRPHEARRHGSVPLLSLLVRDASRRRRLWYQPEVGRESGTGTTEPEECIRPGRPLEGSPVNSFPRIELGAPP